MDNPATNQDTWDLQSRIGAVKKELDSWDLNTRMERIEKQMDSFHQKLDMIMQHQNIASTTWTDVGSKDQKDGIPLKTISKNINHVMSTSSASSSSSNGKMRQRNTGNSCRGSTTLD